MTELFTPKRVFLLCAKSYDWLYPALIKNMRERFGTSFVLVIADDRQEEFAGICAADDLIIPLSKFGPFGSWPEVVDSQAVYARAREFEDKYELAYMRDIVQQDRVLASHFLNNAPNAGLEQFKDVSLPQLADFINRCFDFHERFLEEQKIDLVISRVSGVSETVMVEVATHRRIPVTFIHGSYYGRGAQWSAGPYMGPLAIKPRFDETPMVPVVPRSEIAPGGWNPPKAPQIRTLLFTMLKTVVIYAQFAVHDMRRAKRTRRTPVLRNLLSQVRQFQVKRYLERIGECDIERIASRPFVYVALPDEPEFTVQSMCREFADSRAWFRQLALSVPTGFAVVFKEHQRIGNRARSFYEELLRFPNAVVAHHSLPGVELIERCAATVTVGGSTPVEASQFGKRSVVFGTRNPYSFMPNVTIVTHPADLAPTLRRVLKPQTAEEIDTIKRAGARFRAAVQSLSFDAKGTPLFYGGTRKEIEPGEVSKAVSALVYCVNRLKSALDSETMIGADRRRTANGNAPEISQERRFDAS